MAFGSMTSGEPGGVVPRGGPDGGEPTPGRDRTGPCVVHLSLRLEHSAERILDKQVRSLVSAGYDVRLVAPRRSGGPGAEPSFVAVEPPQGGIARRWRLAWRVFRAATYLRAHLFHLHDPELLAFAWAWKLSGRRVIYDAHRDWPGALAVSDGHGALPRRLLAVGTEALERIAGLWLDGVAVASPGIAVRFPGSRVVLVRDYPLLSRLRPSGTPEHAARPAVVIAAGVKRATPALRELVRAVGRLDASLGAQLWVEGPIDPGAFERHLSGVPGWSRTRCLGALSREELASRLAQSRVAVLLVHPARARAAPLPGALLDYMAAGLPVVAPRALAHEMMLEDAGLFVEPFAESGIAETLTHLLANPEPAERRGRLGRLAVERTVHWEREAGALLTLYGRVVGPATLWRGRG